jgi:hypothetical protein
MMKKRLAAIAAVGAITVAAGVGAPAATALPPQADHACNGLGKALFHSSVSHGNNGAALVGVAMRHRCG